WRFRCLGSLLTFSGLFFGDGRYHRGLGKPFFINHLFILLYLNIVLRPLLLLSFSPALPLPLLLLLLYRYLLL
ncbi:hypothetical protein BGX38DRAFT_1214187, partial [Terfezia claveryi]